MPVKYLMNVPKNNLVFSLHVLWHTSRAHCGHVALQGRTELLMFACSFHQKQCS